MILNYQRFTMSGVGLVSLCLLGFSIVVNAAEAPQSPAQSAKPRQQRSDRKPKPRIDFAAAAAKLGTTEAKLKEALGIPAYPPKEGKAPGPQTNQPQNGQPKNTQGKPRKPEQGRPPRPRLDIKGAAVKLGVDGTETDSSAWPSRKTTHAESTGSGATCEIELFF